MNQKTASSPPENQGRKTSGLILLSYGFRPFFLFGPAFAWLAMINWLLLREGGGLQATEISARDWHIHEMLFGYPSAMIAGFLLTSVPNWTKRAPITGWGLFVLLFAWLAGRLAMLLPLTLPYGWVVLIDGLFLPLLALRIGYEIIAAQNMRNIKIIVPIVLLAGVNIWFQISVLNGGDTTGAIRLGFGALLALIMLIGGRIIPAFTRNWLRSTGNDATPAMFGRFDAFALGITAIALLWWALNAQNAVLGWIFVGAAVLHAVRQSRWAGLHTINNMLLFVLHLIYGFIPLGFLCLGLAQILDDPALQTTALHLFGIGAIGGMTLAVSLRAALGHTGRALKADWAMTAIFALVALAAIVRALAALSGEPGWLLTFAGLLWIAGFGLFTLKVGPWLLSRRQSP